MYALLEAASAGVAHTLLGADRLFVLLALGALRRQIEDSVALGAWWSLGHVAAAIVSAGHLMPCWRQAVEWNMYVSGLLLLSFGLHLALWEHVYSERERFDGHWGGEWSSVEDGASKKRDELEDGPFHKHLTLHRRLFLIGQLMADKFYNFSASAAIGLGALQGLVSPDFAFARGSAWAGQAYISAGLLYCSFGVAIAASACLVATSSWMLTSSEWKSSRSQRWTRRTAGAGLCVAGCLWMLLVVQLDLEISAAGKDASSTGSSASADAASVTCPVPVHFGTVEFGTAPTWEMVNKLDPWWTKDLVELHRRPPFNYKVASSKIGGCGVIAHEDMPAGSRVGLAGILNGPWDYSASLVHVTPWLGVAINHCQNGNAQLHREGAYLYLETKQDVLKGEELTFNYDYAADTVPIERAQPNWSC